MKQRDNKVREISAANGCLTIYGKEVLSLG